MNPFFKPFVLNSFFRGEPFVLNSFVLGGLLLLRGFFFEPSFF
ncbi:hypothetical protein HPHPP1_1542 [Helicobacter pylori Hp P-1]|nr:hypothetical protein HPHPP1_1542 [Helicobacter pylori Hp P-1]EJC18921.1 hypothetical protein HPHPP1B_1566 [Helicobacter pylori Hp P-1b]